MGVPSTHSSARKVVAESLYTHDQVGNRLSKATEDEELRYGYDAIYRLLSARPDRDEHGGHDGDDHDDEHGRGDGHGYGERYRYDPVGNRLSGPANHRHQPGNVYDAANRLLEDQHYRYQYDRNGNLIAKTGKNGHDDEKESWSYRYDFENRLVEVVKHGDNEALTVTFAYDPMGRRVEKRVTEREDGKRQTRTTCYFYDNEDILLETDATGKVTNRYTHGPGIDEPLALVQGKTTYYYHADGLGSIVALTDSKSKVEQEYQYDSFGNLHDQINRVKQPYTYTSREWDKETGLYYYRARYYDAQVGRFISEDPIGFEGGINQFSYSGQNPISNIDPTGLASIGTRPLDVKYIPFNGSWKLYHSQIWYDNEVDNIGFFEKGIRDDYKYSYFNYSFLMYPKHYADDCMRLAVSNVSKSWNQNYSLRTNNCHHFTNAVSKEYFRIVN